MEECEHIASGQFPAPGVPGATFVPGVEEVPEGYEVSWENNRNLPNPDPVRLLHGKSAYQLAVEAGYEGTEVEFAAEMADAAVAKAKAEAAAEAAGKSETNAAGSASAAAQSEQNAKDSEEAARQAAGEAEQLAQAAAGSAGSAFLSEQNAAASEQAAEDAAEEAGNRATAAGNAAGAAARSEANAKISEENAARSEEEAKKAAQEAQGVILSGPAQPGQLLLVKAVDENSKPTEWETVDRTHYCESKTVNLSFDGNLENYEHAAIGDGQYLVKVSDQIFTKEELAGATIIANIQGGDQTFHLDGAAIPDKVDDSPLVSIAELLLILYEDTDALGVPLTVGTYFAYVVDSLQIKTLTNQYEALKKLDNKYVDAEWMATKATYAEELLAETTFNETSNVTNIDADKLSVGEKLTVTVDGVRYTCEVKEFQAEDVSGIYAGNLALAEAGENNGAPFCVIYANTITSVMLMLQNAGATVSIQGESYEYNKLPDGYIPEKFSTPSFDFIEMGMSLIRTHETQSLEVGEDVVAQMLEATQKDKVRVRFKASFHDGANYYSSIVSATANTAVELLNSGRVSAGQFNLVCKAPNSTTESWYAVTFRFESATVYANCTRLAPNPILTSPNGTPYKLSVADDGTLSAVAVT